MAKLIFWGGWGCWKGGRWLGVFAQTQSLHTLNLSFATYYWLQQILSKLDQIWRSWYFEVVGSVEVGGGRTVPTASYSVFKLQCLILTSTTSFIQIRPILAKLVFWGGWWWYGVLEQSQSLHTPNLSFTTYHWLPQQILSKSDQYWRSWYFGVVGGVGVGGRGGWVS